MNIYICYFFPIFKLYYASVTFNLPSCRSVALKGLKELGWGTGELQLRTCKKPSIYGDDFLSHGMSV